MLPDVRKGRDATVIFLDGGVSRKKLDIGLMPLPYGLTHNLRSLFWLFLGLFMSRAICAIPKRFSASLKL